MTSVMGVCVWWANVITEVYQRESFQMLLSQWSNPRDMT